MGVSKVILNGDTLIDVTGDTVASNNLLSGYTATGADGESVTGAYVAAEPVTESLTVTPTTSQQVFNGGSTVTGSSISNVGFTESQRNKSLSLSSSLIVGTSYHATIKYYTQGGFTLANTSEVDFVCSSELTLLDSYIQISSTQGYCGTDMYDYIRVDIYNVVSIDGYLPVTVNAVPVGSVAVNNLQTSQSTPSISVNTSTGLITATNAQRSISTFSKTVSDGYVTTNEVTVPTVTLTEKSNTSQLVTQAGTTITPTESEQTAVAANRYTTGAVKVGAISSTYVGSGITTDPTPTVNGKTVTIPSGYYSEQVTKDVATATQATPSISVNTSTGLITASATQTAGYVSAGTKSATEQLSVQSAVTIIPTESEQTAVAANKYTTGIVKVGAISSTYVGSGITTDPTPTVNGKTVTIPSGYYSEQTTKDVATVGQATPSLSVDTSTGLITSSAKQNEGYVSAGIRTVNEQLTTQVAATYTPTTTDQTIPAQRYLTGVQTIKGDANLVAANIADGVSIFGVTGTHQGGNVSVESLSVNQNGTYTAPTGKAYSPVTVNVAGAPVEAKDVNFFDYDGTLLYSYTASEVANLTQLPANPSHTRLTAQGWNWSLADIKAQILAIPEIPVNVGQMYITASGNTEIDIVLDDPNSLSPYLVIYGTNSSSSVEVDWGDNSSTDTLSGSGSKAVQHVYSSVGNYTITLSGGSFRAYATGSGSRPYLLPGSATNSTNTSSDLYSKCIKAIYVGNNLVPSSYNFQHLMFCEYVTLPSSYRENNNTLPTYSFNWAYNIKYITIPSGISVLGNYAFQNCYNLINVSVPSSVASITEGVFQACQKIKFVTIPIGLTTFSGLNTFNHCQELKGCVIPNSVTEIPSSYTFQNCYNIKLIKYPSTLTSNSKIYMYNCYSLASFTIPNGIEELTANAFANCTSLMSIVIPSSVTTLGNSCFSSCTSIKTIIIPATVTSIGNSAFAYMYTMYQTNSAHFLGTTPPVFGTNVFSGIGSGAKIYVPYSADHSVLNAYKTATNMSNYANYIEEEPQ